MKITGKTLDETDKKIIEFLSAGHTAKEIAHKVWLSTKAIHHRLSVMRKHYDCKTTTALVAHLYESKLV